MAELLKEKPPAQEKPSEISFSTREPDKKPGPEEPAPITGRKAFLYGLAGAFLGSLPGMTVWILLGKFGIRSMILGFFLAAGTVWGFGRMTRKCQLWKGWSILICAGIMISAVYLTQKTIWTWSITNAFQDTTDYLNEQVLAATQDDPDVTEESVRKSVEALNKQTFGFSKGSFGNCYTHFYKLLDFLDLEKNFFSTLAESYISAILGAASLMKNKVRKTVDSELDSSKNNKKTILNTSDKSQGERSNGN